MDYEKQRTIIVYDGVKGIKVPLEPQSALHRHDRLTRSKLETWCCVRDDSLYLTVQAGLRLRGTTTTVLPQLNPGFILKTITIIIIIVAEIK